MRTPSPISSLPYWAPLLLLLPPSLLACAATPKVAYTPAGMGANSVFFIEARADQEREYLVLCHPLRTPPCARVAPGTIRNRAELDAWVESQEQVQDRRGRATQPTIARRPTGTPTPPAGGWADSDEVVAAPTVPGEEGPPVARPGTGVVNIVTPGGWANVYDTQGHFLGQTPIQLRLREGRHLLTLRPFGQPPGDPNPIEVVVVGSETVSVVRDLREESGVPSTPLAE